MTPLQLQVIAGTRDNDLLNLIKELEHADRTSIRGLSWSEWYTLTLIWARLDVITQPSTT